jgi:hypothetical protein
MFRAMLLMILLSGCSSSSTNGPAVKFPSCLFACRGEVKADNAMTTAPPPAPYTR